MFGFFLSKFLPLLVYPLGLTCLLLIASLVVRTRASRRFQIAGLIILYLSSNRFCSDLLVRSLERRYLPPQPLPTAQAIVVLGGGINPPMSPRPWLELSDAGDRLIYGCKLYRDQKAPWLILSGGRVAWRPNSNDQPESQDMATLATFMGVPPRAILQDPTSLNTRQNAENVAQILRSHQLESILLVTSALHMPRAYGWFTKLGISTIPAPTDYLVVDQDQDFSGFEFALGLLPDVGALNHTTNTIKEYLGLILQNF
ncbi:MAG: YdcF family protein [Pseudanabaenaceae cyanobacterium bins.68]|nr:YdcF family protein [Pseudanabaenaceae cyanobacterium bins.68]